MVFKVYNELHKKKASIVKIELISYGVRVFFNFCIYPNDIKELCEFFGTEKYCIGKMNGKLYVELYEPPKEL